MDQQQQSTSSTGMAPGTMMPSQSQQPMPSQTHQGQSMNGGPLLAPPQVPHYLMSYMSNPALAAAAAASPLFPPPVMLSNPGAFLGLPEMYATSGMSTTNTTGVIGNQSVANRFNGNPVQNMSVSHHMNAPMSMSIGTNGNNQNSMMSTYMGNGMDSSNRSMQAPSSSTIGGGTIPTLSPHSSNAMQVQVGSAVDQDAGNGLSLRQDGTNSGASCSSTLRKKVDLSAADKAKQNRDRNREHARSTRLRKKAYVQKLKELVEGLHAERTEEVRKRRVAIQHLAEVQNVRRSVVRGFLRLHSSYESDPRKWTTILEDNFWFKQPVTPYRSFRRNEIEQECRVSRGVDAIIADAASVSVMVEGIGSRSTRWMQIKRDEVIHHEGSRNGSAASMPQNIVRQNGRFQHAVSSLSSSSGSSNGSGSEEDRRNGAPQNNGATPLTTNKKSSVVGGESGTAGPKKAISLGSGSERDGNQKRSNDFHDYNAPSLPDPMLGSGGSSPAEDSAGDSRNSDRNGIDERKRASTDSSSGDDDKTCDGDVPLSPAKRRKVSINGNTGQSHVSASTQEQSMGSSDVMHPPMNTAGNAAASSRSARNGLPPNIAKSGGIAHSIRPVLGNGMVSNVRNGNARLSLAPAISLPPFVGIGKRVLSAKDPIHPAPVNIGSAIESAGISTNSALTHVIPTGLVLSNGTATVSVSQHSTESTGTGGAPNGGDQANSSVGGPAVITADMETSSSTSSNQQQQIRAYYHVNEDDMLLTDDVLMCPFIFRSQDAVLSGALADCIMPGMLRAHFSSRNKLMSLEMVYDAMGFMQQLERASGSEGSAQIVPGSLEMALSPSTVEARVITLAKAPFLIVSVNEAWTRMTRYTQMEVEGLELSVLHGSGTNPEAETRSGKPARKLGEVSEGRCACSTNIHYDKNGREFVDFVCSYPLTNANDEITHILHVYKELPAPTSASHEFPESSGSEDFQNQ